MFIDIIQQPKVGIEQEYLCRRHSPYPLEGMVNALGLVLKCMGMDCRFVYHKTMVIAIKEWLFIK